MDKTLTFAPERFPVLYQDGEPTAVLVDIQTFRRIQQMVVDNWLNRPSGETALSASSAWMRPLVEQASLPAEEPRPFGLCAGEFTVPDDFDAPLPEQVLREFEGG